jgi:hypothetical protein
MSAVRSRRAPGKTAAGVEKELEHRIIKEGKDRRRSSASSCSTRLLLAVCGVAFSFSLASIAFSSHIQFESRNQRTRFARVVLLNNNDRNETLDSISIDSQQSRKRPRKVEHMIGNRARAEIAESKRYAELDEIDWDGKEDCQLEYEWQRTSRPACNSMHEFDLTTPSLESGGSKYKFLTHGFYRDVLSAFDQVGEPFVFKPMRRKHRFTYRNFDRMRRDAVIMDRLTAHKYILNIYGFCGTSAVFEFADGGDIDSTLWPDGETRANLTQLEKLHIGMLCCVQINGNLALKLLLLLS